MTDAQRTRTQAKIDRYKKALAGALRYHSWFWKNFPDDIGEPVMYLAWTALFYHRSEIAKARINLRSTLFSNLHLIPQVIGKPVGLYDMWYGSNIEEPGWFEGYDFRSLEFLTPAFLAWLEEEYRSEELTMEVAHFVELNRKLKDEHDTEKREVIVEELAKMRYGGRGGS